MVKIETLACCLITITDQFQKIPLYIIQLRLRILGQHLEVVADDHGGEDPASSEQHGDVAVDGVAEGQQDDVGFELMKYFE